VTAVRPLTGRELQRSVLARQLLLTRTRSSIPAALERVGGLQAQYAPAMYVGLWSRIEGFIRTDLTTALERRDVVQGTLMRSTIHLVSKRDYWPFALAVRASRREWWVRTYRVDPAEMRSAARRVRRALGAHGVLPGRELDRIAGATARNGIGLWIDLVRVPPSGTWARRRADLFALAEDWIGPPPDVSAPDAITHLVRRYLQAFGPSSTTEISLWAGMNADNVDTALASLRLRAFLAEDGERLVDLPRQPLPGAEADAPVRFLSTWEALLLVHARRALLIREEDRSRIFAKTMPQSKPTFLVDGQVAGTWRHVGERVEIEPFRRLSAPSRRAVEAEAARLVRVFE